MVFVYPEPGYFHDKHIISPTSEMNIPYGSYTHIQLPQVKRDLIIAHCQRKLASNFIDGESRERKAYGLLAGSLENNALVVRDCFPLLKNARTAEAYRGYMDTMMTAYATDSETPLDRRGWVADPSELLGHVKNCHRLGVTFAGTYHMHRVGWGHDPFRDTPTTIDARLAEGSELLMLIVSMVNPEQPIIRAFHEGAPDKEIPIIIA